MVCCVLCGLGCVLRAVWFAVNESRCLVCGVVKCVCCVVWVVWCVVHVACGVVVCGGAWRCVVVVWCGGVVRGFVCRLFGV